MQKWAFVYLGHTKVDICAKSGLLCIWDTQKWTFVYVRCWGWDKHSLPLCMCGIGAGACKSGLLCIWDTQK